MQISAQHAFSDKGHWLFSALACNPGAAEGNFQFSAPFTGQGAHAAPLLCYFGRDCDALIYHPPGKLGFIEISRMLGPSRILRKVSRRRTGNFQLLRIFKLLHSISQIKIRESIRSGMQKEIGALVQT